MDVLETIKTRRSVRRYKRVQVEDDKIARCLEAARWAPSADNLQPWSAIVIKNQDTRRRLSEIHTWGGFMADSPVVMAFLAHPGESPVFYYGDTAVAVQNFLLAAHSLGLGTCWIGVIGSPFEQPIKQLLGVPDDVKVLCMVSLGYPDEEPRSDRRPLEEIVHWEKYGSRRR